MDPMAPRSTSGSKIIGPRPCDRIRWLPLGVTWSGHCGQFCKPMKTLKPFLTAIAILIGAALVISVFALCVAEFLVGGAR